MTTMTLTTACDKIAAANMHWLIANHPDDDRAESMLFGRCVNMMIDRIEEDDDKGAELNNALDAMNASPGPLAASALRAACRRAIFNARS